jgi:organic hydroperoxide reductase OsmC/OhrA
MAKTLYTAEAQVTGGRLKGHGKTTDGALEVDIRVPSELGGDGGGTNPEQLAAELVKAAHEVCPYSNATRGNIDVRLTVNGQDVS